VLFFLIGRQVLDLAGDDGRIWKAPALTRFSSAMAASLKRCPALRMTLPSLPITSAPASRRAMSGSSQATVRFTLR